MGQQDRLFWPRMCPGRRPRELRLEKWMKVGVGQ